MTRRIHSGLPSVAPFFIAAAAVAACSGGQGGEPSGGAGLLPSFPGGPATGMDGVVSPAAGTSGVTDSDGALVPGSPGTGATVADPDQVGPAGSVEPSPSGGSGGATGNPINPDGTETANLPDEPSAGSVRRLTHVEYDNTIAVLLGDESRPSSAFEAEVAQNGFTNNGAGQNVSPALTEQYMVAAETLSRSATQNVPELLGCDPAVVGEDACVRQFIEGFGRRAWRRPLSQEEQGRLFELFSTVRAEFEFDVSIQLVVQAFLQSPQFIYLLEPSPADAVPGSAVPLDSWEVATRLSYFLLGSMPDPVLFTEAEAGALQTPEAVVAQARRLLELPRARERIALFFTEWLRLRNIDRKQKDATLFPNYDLAMGALMRQQVELFAQSIILDESGTVTDLLTAPYTFVNRELAPLYGVAVPADDQFHRVDLDPTQRAGLLTHVAVMANLAHGNQTDPVVRGKFVRTGLLCDAIPAPPADAVITVPEITPGATTRERFTQHQEDPICATCHQFMDPIGLGFEHYDPLGQWRDMDNGLPVDATGEIVGTDVAGPFNGALELSQKLAGSEQALDCFARTWLRFALGRSDLDVDAGALAVADERFRASGFEIKELLVALTETRAFRYQVALDPNTGSLEQEAP